MKATTSQQNQSLIDGIRCFQELTTSERPLGTKELSERLGLNMIKVNRLLRTLKSIGMAEQNQQKKYRPGPVVHVLAAQSFHSSALFRAATHVAIRHPYDDRTLAIGILWKDAVVYMYHALAGQNPAEGLGGYHLYNASQSSIGKALLAEMDGEELEQCVAGWSPEDRAGLSEIIAEIRRQGFACQRDAAGRINNIAATFQVGGARAGIAFTDLVIEDGEVERYVAELRTLIGEIESYA